VRAAVIRTFPVSAVEGTSFSANLASVTLPNLPRGAIYTATITWGNGRTTNAQLLRATPTGTTYTVRGGTTYTTIGSANIVVTIRNGTATVLTATTSATVADAAFTVVRTAPPVGRAGTPFRASLATITDSNPLGGKASDFTATIVWSNGRTMAGTVRRTAAGKFEVVGDATFGAAGRSGAKVTIRAVGGATTTVTTTFEILPAARR